MHELDEFVEGLRMQPRNRAARKQRNLAYQRLSLTKELYGQTRRHEDARVSTRQSNDANSSQHNGEMTLVFIRIKYLRYADDWIVGIWGSRALAEQVKAGN